MSQTTFLHEHNFDSNCVEEAFDFAVHELDDQSTRGAPRQFCVAIERPNLTLDKVVSSMSSNRDYQLDSEMRGRYLKKVCAVLRTVAKAIRHLHSEGVVHGNVCPQNCGKFDDKWKVMGLMEAHNVGALFNPSIMGESSPPESIEALRDSVEAHSHSASRRVTFKSRIVAETSVDVWAFGKLAYEVLTGEPLIHFEAKKGGQQDNRALLKLMKWNEADLRLVMENLEKAGISSSGADLIAHCLLPDPHDRPTNMDWILEHEFWSDMRRNGTISSKSNTQRRLHGHRGSKR